MAMTFLLVSADGVFFAIAGGIWVDFVVVAQALVGGGDRVGGKEVAGLLFCFACTRQKWAYKCTGVQVVFAGLLFVACFVGCLGRVWGACERLILTKCVFVSLVLGWAVSFPAVSIPLSLILAAFARLPSRRGSPMRL